MFKINGGKGFHVTFDNGYTVSVQFGPGNYCDNYDMEIGTENREAGANGSRTAECAVWAGDGGMIEHETFEGNTVGGYRDANQILELMNWAASQGGVSNV